MMGQSNAGAVEQQAPLTCCCETLAIATVPIQNWCGTYELEQALKNGTVFPELNKPFFMGGDEIG